MVIVIILRDTSLAHMVIKHIFSIINTLNVILKHTKIIYYPAVS